MKIRQRAYLLGMLPALLLALMLGAYLGFARLGDMQAAIEARGHALAKHLATTAEYGVLSGNRRDLNNLLEQIRTEPDVAQVAVLSPSGQVLARTGAPTGRTWRFAAPVLPRYLQSLDEAFPDRRADDAIERKPIARVELVMSLERYLAARNAMLLTVIGIVLLGLAFAAVLARGLALASIRPLLQLIAGVQRVSQGDFGVQVPATAQTELYELQVGFNRMASELRSLRDNLQEQVVVATTELAAQKDAAVAAVAAKSHFLAAASHDLRQPMHAIGLYVEAMRPMVQGRAAATTLDKLAASVNALESQFNAILDLSRLDAGAVAPQAATLVLKPFLVALTDTMQVDAAHRGLDLRVRACKGSIECDPQLLERLLRNLLANAMRYTPRGGVLLSARRRGAGALIQVWDTGIGIAASDLPRITDEFFQVQNPGRDRSQGLGLGLTIVRRLADLLGYKFGVRSTMGRGSVFSVSIPRCTQTTETPRALIEGADFTRLRGRVALVDDDPQVLDALVTLLSGWGLDVVAADSGDALCAALVAPPDVLITDWRLAHYEHGSMVVQKVRRQFRDARFGVIVITGDTLDESAQQTGFPVLFKPVKPARLRAFVAQMLREVAPPVLPRR